MFFQNVFEIVVRIVDAISFACDTDVAVAWNQDRRCRDCFRYRRQRIVNSNDDDKR